MVRRRNRKWDENLVISSLKALPQTNYNYVRKHDESLLKACRKFYGTLEAAVKAAGLEYKRL